jgi:2-keto-4-pentenoate hydratase/2-oxohepta-3-ene-1,7-dioic acid hydratase in catechol pathway
MRFVQYKKKGSECPLLGVSSDNGESIKELNQLGCYPNNLKALIEQDIKIDEIKQKIAGLESIKESDVTLLSPITEPQKILCVGLNYRGHCDEQKKEYPKEPMFFSKYASTIVGPTDNVIAHKITNQVNTKLLF